MPKIKKPSQAMTVRLEQSIYDALTEFSKQSGQSKTVAVERALLMYFDSFNNKGGEK